MLLTLDLFLNDAQAYERALARQALQPQAAARLYGVAPVKSPAISFQNCDTVLEPVTVKVRRLLPGPWQVAPHVYGRGPVCPLPPERQASHEAGLVLEFLAPEAELARTAASEIAGHALS